MRVLGRIITTLPIAVALTGAIVVVPSLFHTPPESTAAAIDKPEPTPLADEWSAEAGTVAAVASTPSAREWRMIPAYAPTDGG